jgi:seryl-tRNA(Sec) selenium transferase
MINTEIARVVGEILALVWLAIQTFLARKNAASAERSAAAAEKKADQILGVVQQVNNRLQQAQSQAVKVEVENVFYGVSGSAVTPVKSPEVAPPPGAGSESPLGPRTE